jgi:hypothetical protein
MKPNIHFWSNITQLFLEWEMFQTKVVEKVNTHFTLSNFFSILKSCLLWNNVEKFCTSGQATDDNMGHAHCIFKATNSHSKYVIITASPLQQWLKESASMLRYTYIVCCREYKHSYTNYTPFPVAMLWEPTQQYKLPAFAISVPYKLSIYIILWELCLTVHLQCRQCNKIKTN